MLHVENASCRDCQTLTFVNGHAITKYQWKICPWKTTKLFMSTRLFRNCHPGWMTGNHGGTYIVGEINNYVLSCSHWNATNRWHPPTSPNTAPATQNDCHNWSSSHVKRYFQCAEQPVSSWNISEYCACHAKWLSNISKKFLENSWNVISNAGPIRAWSELDPSRKPSSATRLATEVTFQDHHEHFVLNYRTG